jgi:hypothetical protein
VSGEQAKRITTAITITTTTQKKKNKEKEMHSPKLRYGKDKEM